MKTIAANEILASVAQEFLKRMTYEKYFPVALLRKRYRVFIQWRN
jgi:hypothetical protein